MRADFDVARAYRLQLTIAERAITRDAFSEIRVVAGVDLSYLRGEEEGIAIIVLLDYPSLKPIEVRMARGRVPLEYVPGLLAFREAPLAYVAYRRLTREPDLLVIDGHGRAHPRKAGIATHIGVALDKPSIGVAKKRLTGVECKYDNLQALCLGNEPVALILERSGKRLYISPGHRVSLRTAYNLVKKMFRGRMRLPAPTYVADKLSKEAKKLQECRAGTNITMCEEKLLQKALQLVH